MALRPYPWLALDFAGFAKYPGIIRQGGPLRERGLRNIRSAML